MAKPSPGALLVDEIRAEMGRQRLSVRRLANLVGLANTTLSYRLNHPGKVAYDAFAELAEALGVPFPVLVTRAYRRTPAIVVTPADGAQS